MILLWFDTIINNASVFHLRCDRAAFALVLVWIHHAIVRASSLFVVRSGSALRVPFLKIAFASVGRRASPSFVVVNAEVLLQGHSNTNDAMCRTSFECHI